MSEREVTALDGTRIHARVSGREDRPWLILSNSLATDLRLWDDQIGLLIQHWRVVRYDSRGHGQSAAPAGPYDFDMLVKDMIAVLDAVGAARADVIGISLGGMTALGLGLSAPERVGRMLVCDARADAPPAFVKSWDDRIAVLREAGMAGLVSTTLDRWFTPAVSAGVLARAREMVLATAPEGYAGCVAALRELDYLRHLPRMSVPVTYAVGELDGGAPVAAMQAMADATLGGRLRILPALAHIPNMENPAAFAALVEKWRTS